MEKQIKPDTSQLLRKGLRELSLHRPDRAVETLRQAVELIPPACAEELSHALYWLSVALLRLDKRELAIKSLASAQKLRRRGHARRIYLRNVNLYGMPRQPTPELDDFHAFMNIQIAAYLVRKSRHRFASHAEHDTVIRILLSTWKKLLESNTLTRLECGEKLQLFKRIKPDFPFFGLPAANTIVAGSFGFYSTTQTSQPDRCVCGSGLPYTQCCGRVRGLGEL